MIDNISLDIFIGLVFIYLLYSLLASIMMELIAQLLKLRGKMLKKAIRVMLEDWSSDGVNQSKSKTNDQVLKKTLADAFYQHPSIKYLAEDPDAKSKPSYIAPQNFSNTLVSILRGREYDGSTPVMTNIHQALYPNGTANNEPVIVEPDDKGNGAKICPETLRQLRQLYIDSQKDIDRFKALLENWFNETMERNNGWYVKKTKNILLAIGFTLAVWGNVDSIKIYHILANNNTAQELLANKAVQSYQGYGPAVDVLRGKNESGGTVTALATSEGENTTATLTLSPSSTGNATLDSANKKLQADIQEVNKILGLGWHTSNDYKKYKDLKDEFSKYQKNADRCAWLEKEIDRLQKHLTLPLRTESIDALKWEERRYLRLQSEYAKIPVVDRNRLIELQSKANKSYQKANDRFWFWSPFGWLITAFAITLGAPFWFDLLNKLVSIRSAGKKPKEEVEDITSKKSSSSGTGSTVPEAIKVTQKVG